MIIAPLIFFDPSFHQKVLSFMEPIAMPMQLSENGKEKNPIRRPTVQDETTYK
jgi:hypothetical protein